MAKKLDAFDFRSMDESLRTTSSDRKEKRKVVKLKATVLSWNLARGNGPEATAEATNLLVPRIVSHFNPDVLLLQQLPSDQKIIDKITSYIYASHKREYQQVRVLVPATEKKHARILYDTDVFEVQPAEPPNLHKYVAEVFPAQQRETRHEQTMPEERVYEGRMAAVHLRHKETGKVIVFLSFNNHYPEKIIVEKYATGFCKIVSRMAKDKSMLVLAGADLKCEDFEPGNTHVPGYHRRNHKDFFLYACPRAITVADKITVTGDDPVDAVTAVDIFPDDDSDDDHDFKGVVQDLERSGHTYAYKDSLKHDPLVYKLRVNYH